MSVLLKNWMDKSSRAQQERLASLAGISRGYLYQLAADKRDASADVASRLEEAAKIMALTDTIPSQLPRYLVAKSCGSCPYARKCAAESVEVKQKEVSENVYNNQMYLYSNYARNLRKHSEDGE